jgi:hypothetical protein
MSENESYVAWMLQCCSKAMVARAVVRLHRLVVQAVASFVAEIDY